MLHPKPVDWISPMVHSPLLKRKSFSRCWPVQKLNESVWRTQKEKQAESMRRFEPQLFVCFALLFCSLASCRAKPRLSFGPEGWYNPLDSYFGTLSWNKSEADPREDGSTKEAESWRKQQHTNNKPQPTNKIPRPNQDPTDWISKSRINDWHPAYYISRPNWPKNKEQRWSNQVSWPNK